MSSTKTIVSQPHGPVGLQAGASRRSGPHPGRTEAIERERLLDRLQHLRTIVPVFAQELASARRQAAWLRAENSWLLEQVRQLQRQPAHNHPSGVLPGAESDDSLGRGNEGS